MRPRRRARRVTSGGWQAPPNRSGRPPHRASIGRVRLPSQVNLGRRFMWWPPWHVTNPWRLRLWQGSDEWCRRSACLDLPLLGTFIVFWERELRTMPCGDCWREMDEATRAGYLPGGYLEGGVVHQDRADALFAEAGSTGSK